MAMAAARKKTATLLRVIFTEKLLCAGISILVSRPGISIPLAGVGPVPSPQRRKPGQPLYVAQVQLDLIAGPGSDAAPKEVLIFSPDGRIDQQSGRHNR